MRSSNRLALAAIALAAALTGGCAAPAYRPLPLDFADPLPADAFHRCRAVLLQQYETLRRVDREAFLLQTEWQPIQDPPGERRASVFRDPDRENSLNVVVELRRLSIPWFGLPRWAEPVGDDLAERELAEVLRQSLNEPGSAP